MINVQSILQKAIKIIFTVFIILIAFVNIKSFYFEKSTILTLSIILVLISALLIYIYNKWDFLNKKLFIIIICIYFLLGIIIRLHLINNLNFELKSDFEFAYENAISILNGNMSQMTKDYLSFNGYHYLFSYFISILFRIFPKSVYTIIFANFLMQAIANLYFYKIIRLNHSTETALILSATFCLFPNVIFANLLVATETPFLMAFFITLYYFYKIINNRTISVKNIIFFALFGLLMAITNYVRPVMSIFIIAFIIYFLLKFKHLKELLLILVVCISFKCGDIALNSVVEHTLGQETRSGALGWSIYFGSNYDTIGQWSLEDSSFTSNFLLDKSKGDKDLIIESLKRYDSYGFAKSFDLLSKKFENLWKDNVGTFTFLNDVVDKEKSDIDIIIYYKPLDIISRIFVIIICLSLIYSLFTQWKKTNWLFVELFAIGYILSNLLVCLNGRYGLPLYPMLILLVSPILDNLLCKKEKSKNIPEIENTSSQLLSDS